MVQSFQPVRYYFLAAPAIALLGGFAMVRIVSEPGAKDRIAGPIAAAVMFSLFELAYIGANALANPAVKVRQVREWAEANVRPSERIMAPSYFAVDIPVRAYSHYYFAEDSAQLLASVDSLEIDYVIFDEEWDQSLRPILDARFDRAHEFPFATAYRSDPPR